MELKPMTDFVLESAQKLRHNDDCEFAYVVRKYANFLKQPLTLGMFVPCDEGGNVLEEPKNYKEWLRKSINIAYDIDLSKYDQYQQAKERVLFEGFKIMHNDIIAPSGGYFNRNILKYDIEFIVGSDLTLTQSAIKQLGL